MLYITARRQGAHAVPRAIEMIDALPVSVVDADRALTLRATILKASGDLDYADAFCAALAQTLDAPVLTADGDFEALADDGALRVERIR